MASNLVLVGLYYAYPLALYAGLSASLLISQVRQSECQSDRNEGRTRHYFHIIYFFQAVLSAVLVASLGIAISSYVASLRKNEYSMANEAHLICTAAVLLYFIVGLLPDPEVSFHPSASHSRAWMIACVFELLLLATLWRTMGQEKPLVQWSLGITRLLCLFCMCTIFHWPRASTKANGEETESLLNGSNGPSYRSIPVGAPPKFAERDITRKSSWVDYLIGFRLLFPYIWPSRDMNQQLKLLICLILMFGQRSINILVPYQLEVLINDLGNGKMPFRSLLLYVFYRGLQGQQGILGSIRAIIWIPISQGLFRRLTCAAFEHIMTLSLEFHLSKRIGEVMSALNKGSALNTFLDSFAFQLFPMVFDLGVAAVYFLIRFDAFYSLILIGVMWSYIYMTMYMAQWRLRARRQMATKDREMDAVKTDTMMSYETVHHNGALPVEVNRFATYVGNYQEAEYSVLLSLNALNITQNMILTLGILMVVLLASLQISLGARTVAMFVSILAYFTQLQAPLQFFGSFYNQVQNSLVDAERMLALFNEKPTLVDAHDAQNMAQCHGKISFEDVCFAYDQRKLALDKISFTVEPGTSTAIVGESGSGKSTCLKLLFRFYDVSGGNIRIDGKDVRDLKLADYRKHIAVVPQDTILFNTTILYNLQYANPNASLEEVYAACRAASIHDRIMNFPEGYETKVGERGLRLSGGEKQRIAIARALLKDPHIMLLDEATASLDSHTEKQIQGALETATTGRSTITIAHRLSTITKSDQILVLKEGRIIERGTHGELLQLNGNYWNMWKKQNEAQHQPAH
ncbi:hypothetical protein CC80DRAFT_529081 [Byssothecium circinans]|uniref:Heavy metal tolerance protein n=1 Tax=Byssothecium circinans TaxID=147558 RepID=A0A6A5TBL1_9PLEO|nr:hypothetical protein CC80DRAFT_529081 [Byssothecium circinans]